VNINFHNPSGKFLIDSVDLRQLTWPDPLICDYCYNFERLEAFYVGSPITPTTLSKVIESRKSWETNKTHIGDIVTAQLQSRSAPPQALKAAEKLKERGTVAILTGQQAGLFGGPLFTLLKSLTAIALARQVEKDYNVAAVPVFWIDAEDHDLDEIRTCDLLDNDFNLHQVDLKLPQMHSGQPAASVPLPDSITQTIETLYKILPKTEFSQEIFEQLVKAYSPGTSLVEAFSRWLDIVLGPTGLVVFDSSDKTAKPLVRSIFTQELQSRGKVSGLATLAGKNLSALGYHSQVNPRTDSVAIFHIDQTRRPVRLRDNEFEIENTTWTTEQLINEVQKSPGSFSPSVLLRPIVQDTLFPTIAYVAGPSELAYLGQLKQIYAEFKIPMPLVYPRLSATITDGATMKFLKRYKVNFETLQNQDDGVLNQLLADNLPSDLDNIMKDTEQSIYHLLQKIKTEVPLVDPTLTEAVQTTKKRIERDLQNLRSKIIKAAKRKNDTLQRQFYRARSLTFPKGKAQERNVAFLYFLNRYGPKLVDQLLANLPLKIGNHYLLSP